MKIDKYCQRQHCKHVELEQFLACFRVAWVCHQRPLGFLILLSGMELRVRVRAFAICFTRCLTTECAGVEILKIGQHLATWATL